MQILGLLGMYFDAVVVEVENNLLLFNVKDFFGDFDSSGLCLFP